MDYLVFMPLPLISRAAVAIKSIVFIYDPSALFSNHSHQESIYRHLPTKTPCAMHWAFLVTTASS